MEAIQVKTESLFKTNYNVIVALFLRELKTRFGQQRLGLLWLFLEPAAHMLTFTAIYQMRGQTEIHGISVLLFILSGIQPFNYFSAMMNRTMTAASSNKGLFSFRQVKPIHAFISRWILETLIFVIVYCAFIGIGLWFGIGTATHDLELLLISYTILGVMGAGVGTTCACIIILFPETEKIIPLVMRPLYFLSGIFFSSHLLPTSANKILSWNPIFVVIDMGRHGYFGTPTSPLISLSYAALFAATSLMLGLYLYNKNWKKMVGT